MISSLVVGLGFLYEVRLEMDSTGISISAVILPAMSSPPRK